MTLTPDGKAQIIAAVLKSPLVMRIYEQHPVTKWDEPKELAFGIAHFAAAVIAEAEKKIP